MKMTQRMMLLPLLALSICARTGAAPKQARRISLERYLIKTGTQLDCYFTIETQQLVNPISEQSGLYIPNEPVESIGALQTKLRGDLKNFTVGQDEKNPLVIHISQNSLSEVKGYALNARKSLSHLGSMGELITKPGQQLGLEDGYKDFRPPPDSQASKLILSPIVRFTAEDTPVRGILTDNVPLSYFRRILWVATTFKNQDIPKTKIWYLGRGSGLSRTDESYWQSSPKPQNPFAMGEFAYLNRANSDENTAFTLSFIETQMKQPAPLQVRWAMFWLGKNNVEKGIPVLLKYLDYEYTTVPLLDERFPAFRALKEIGVPAAQAALETLRKESRARRLELLCRIVLSVQGEIEGRKALQKILDATTDATQKARIQNGWKLAEQPTASAVVTWPEEMRAQPAAPQTPAPK